MRGLAQDTARLSALSRLFSPGVFHEMAKKSHSPLFARLIYQTGLLNHCTAADDVGSVFDAAFSALRSSGLRNEYIYRAAVTRNVLLGRHSLNTASMLTEFRAGTSKADLVILNGTSTVYEIKSDRDSLTRLPTQIANYRKVFANIYVIAGEKHINEVIERTPVDVGVMSLVRWDRIRTVREAVDYAKHVCPATIFDSLRVTEAREILEALNVPVPDVPNTMLFSAMRECFTELEPVEVHKQMVRTLKRTRSLSALGRLVEQLPESLKPAALSVRIRRADYDKLVTAIRTPLNEAMTWGR